MKCEFASAAGRRGARGRRRSNKHRDTPMLYEIVIYGWSVTIRC